MLPSSPLALPPIAGFAGFFAVPKLLQIKLLSQYDRGMT
jgi:hypothetical protein